MSRPLVPPKLDRLLPCAVLSAALTLPCAAAAAPPGEEQRYKELEHATTLELSREWAAYNQAGVTRPFVDFVDHRYRFRRDLGRGLVMAGAGITILGGFLFSLGASDTKEDGRTLVVTSLSMFGLAGGLSLVGGLLWGIYARRLDKLEGPSLALGPRGRLHLRSAGLGLRLNF